MDDYHAAAALDAVAEFTLEGPGLATRIRAIEAALDGVLAGSADLFADSVGATRELLEGALIVKRLAGQINVVIHAVGILRSLPHILAPGEKVLSSSLGAGSTGRAWDLETDLQVAEFKFITWQGGNEGIRQNVLFVDVFHLAEATTSRRRVMYVTNSVIPLAFLETSGRAIGSVLSKHSEVAKDFERRHGGKFLTVRDYWAEVRDRVEVVDITKLMPWPGPPVAG